MFSFVGLSDFVLVVMGIEYSALCMLGRHSTAKLVTFCQETNLNFPTKNIHSVNNMEFNHYSNPGNQNTIFIF